jgi:hypothetical protein
MIMILKIIFWLLLADSLIANYISWTSSREYFNKFKFFKRYMPITKGWTVGYLILALFIGYLIYGL